MDRISYESQDRTKKEEAFPPQISDAKPLSDGREPGRTPDHVSKTETLQMHQKSPEIAESGGEHPALAESAQEISKQAIQDR
jgi:hypothetical protein